MTTRNTLGGRSARSAQVHLLRSRVEVEVKKPGVVMVTSGHHGDGKKVTARALAVGLKMQGYRTAIVGLGPGRVEKGEAWELFDGDSDNAPVIEELRGYEGGEITAERLAAFVNRMRGEYEYTVVVADTFLSSPPTMALSRLVDGILLAVRIGRPPSDDDGLMVRLIEQSRGRIVGVVAIEAPDAGKIRRSTPQEHAAPVTKQSAASATPSVRAGTSSRLVRTE